MNRTPFYNVTSLQELKEQYRNLARRWHPDRGGNLRQMQQLNSIYEQLKKELSRKPVDFRSLAIGDKILVNKTLCTVILITKNKFVARADGRSKQAWFSLETGLCLDFPHYRAILIH